MCRHDSYDSTLHSLKPISVVWDTGQETQPVPMADDKSNHEGAASDGRTPAGDSGRKRQRRLLVVPSWSNHVMSNAVPAETSQVTCAHSTSDN